MFYHRAPLRATCIRQVQAARLQTLRFKRVYSRDYFVDFAMVARVVPIHQTEIDESLKLVVPMIAFTHTAVPAAMSVSVLKGKRWGGGGIE